MGAEISEPCTPLACGTHCEARCGPRCPSAAFQRQRQELRSLLEGYRRDMEIGDVVQFLQLRPELHDTAFLFDGEQYPLSAIGYVFSNCELERISSNF